MGKSKLGLFSVLLVISVLWKPAYTNECSTACKGKPSSKGLLPNTKYNYGVEGTVSVYLTGSTDNKETSVKLLGQVAVTSLGNCGHELTVQNLVISGPDGKKYQSPPGIDKPVRFSLEDGRLSAALCTSEGDTRRSLNIKRAIISLLQTELKSTTQVDIFGACPTDISSSSEGGSSLVHRTRDLGLCAHREQGKNGLIASVLNENAEIKETQVLQSTLHVESKVNAGVPEKVSASEEYLYKPFSVGENGARAKVHTKLTLTGKTAGAAGATPCTVARSIIFDAPRGAPLASNDHSALAAVKDTAKALDNEASEASAGNFASLIRIFRVTKKDDLIKVWGQVKGNNIEKRVYLDALLRTGTGSSIEASISILKSHALSDIETQLVYLSLGNAKQVTDEALKAATSLLDQPNIPKELYLGVGALAGAYCRSTNCHSDKSDGIVALSTKLGAELQNCKPKTKVDEDRVVAVLKGIRNIHHLENSLIERLAHSASDLHVKARVKAAVLEAFKADPCNAKLKSTALGILKNRQLDSEIRIKAYQAVIACPCSRSANEIKTLLDSEPVHQVGRYITSSLRAIRSSTSPDKQLAKQHYANIGTPSKFNVDDRKYSFYREASYNVDALGVGGALEQSVIYSQNSFLPRSASLNLTTEIFGHHFNILELGGRQGNLDLVIEHFLGPKGILKTKGAQAIYDILVKAFHQSSEKVKSALNRERRSIKSEVDNFDKNLKAEELHFDNELDLDIYVKLFGTDAVFLSLGDDKGFDYNRLLDSILQAVHGGIGKAQRMSNTIRTNLLFLDAELAYPTSAGLPLRLDLTGAVTARVDFSTNFDLKQCLSNPQNAKIDIKLIPSSDIEITGTLLVDADAVATGLKVTTNLHSSTGGHLVAKVLDNGSGIDIQFGLPVEKQEILVASNNLVYVTVEKGQKEKQTKIAVDGERKDYAECFDQLSGLLGLTLCSEVSLPFSVSGPEAQASIGKYLARYPLSGQSKLKLVLEKNDLKGYHIRGLVKNEGKTSTLDLLFEAEGSKNRRTQLVVSKTASDSEWGLKLALTSPIKSIGGDVFVRNTPSELTASANANIDAERYYGKIGFLVSGNQQRSVYKPILEYKTPAEEKFSAHIDGEVIREVSGAVTKYNFDGVSIKLPNSQEPIAVQGFASHEANKRNVEWRLVSDLLTLKGHLKASDIELEFFNKLNPTLNFILKGQYSGVGEVMKNEFDISYSGDCKDQSRRLIIGQFLKYQGNSEKNFNVITKNKLEILAIPFKIALDADIDPKKVEIEFDFKNVDQTAELGLKARTQTKHPGDYSVKLNANLNKNGVEVLSKRDVINNDKSNFENYVAVKGAGKYELSGVVLHRTKSNDLNIGAVGHLKVTGKKSEEIKFDIGLVQKASICTSHAQVSSGAGQLLDFLLKVNIAANSNAKLKFILKDAIAANGQAQYNQADGKGNGAVIVDFKKSQRKVKVDVKFQAKEPSFSGDFDVYLNWEKDNNDKICFTTNTKKTENLLDTKNKLEFSGKTTEVNVHLTGEPEAVGKSQANVEVVLPSERRLALKFHRDVAAKGSVYNGDVKLQLTDSPKGGEPSSISYEGKVVNSDLDKVILDYQGELEFKVNSGKTFKTDFLLKNQPAGGDKWKFDFKSQVSGNILPKPASLVTSLTYLDNDNLFVDDEVYHLKASYGDDTSVDLNGKSEYNLDSKADKKYLDDFTVIVRLPFEKAHDIKWVSSLLFLLPQNKDAEYTIIQSVQVNADVWKVDANGKAGPHAGSGTVKLLVPQVEPVVLDASYKADNANDRKSLSTEVKAKYGKGKTVALSLETISNPNGNLVHIRANAPDLDKLKKLEINVESRHPAPDTYFAAWEVNADSRVYKTESTVVLSKAHPVLDLKYTSPTNGKISRIYVKGTSLSSTQGKVEVKVDNIRDISLEATSEASVQKDNVNFKISAHSEKLGWKHFVGEIVSKDSGSGKRLEFRSTNDNKNVLSGSTSYISKTEDQKTIIEGSGSVKLQEEQKSANFKYIRTILTEGNEKGVETFFKVAFGERSYVAESRVTNYEYKNSHLYCEEKKQCAHAELQSKIDTSKPGVIANVVSAGFDLRKLGIAPELGLVVRDEVSASRLPQYTLDLHANKEDRKYHLHVYSTPDFGHAKSGIKIQLPSRVILLENSVAYPTDKWFPIKGELILDLDKTKPGHKTAARFLVDLDIAKEDKQSAVAELGFSHPKIDKEALIRISGNAARHSDNAFKIETSAKISHSSLGKDHEARILLDVSPTHLNFLINTPLVKVIDIEASGALKDKLQKADVKFVLLEGKPVKVELLVKDYQYYEFTTAEADRKLSVIGHIEPEKRLDISADIILGGQKKNLIHGALWLDNDRIKSDYGASKDHCDYFYKALRKDLDELGNRVKGLGEKANSNLKDIAKRVEPSVERVKEAYAEDIKRFYQEVADDKVLKEISQAISDVAKYVAKLIEEVTKALEPITNKLNELYVDFSKKIAELYEKQWEPAIKKLTTEISAALRAYLDSVIEVVAQYAAIVTDFFEKHKLELNELTNTIAEIFKDLTRLLVAQLKEYRAKVTEIFSEVTEWLKNLPIFKEWSNVALPEPAVEWLSQGYAALRPLLPTPETQALGDCLNEYIVKKLKHEKVDDAKELRAVYQKLVTALRSVVEALRGAAGALPIGTQLSWWNWNPANAGSAPILGGSAAFSALRQLIYGDFPSPAELIKAYRPRSLDPLKEVPSELRGVVVNGQHIFTFDGRHLTFPGSCRYVLAHDYVDRNFTLLIQLAGGRPKALVLEDKSGAVIELKDNGQVILNGANHGFPVLEKDAFAYRQADGLVGIGSLYGIHARCSKDLRVCHIEVSGFYLGKLRGLLGDGNNEPFDDFRLPNGKIASTEAEFGNAYRLAASCPAAAPPAHAHAQLAARLPEPCERVFGGTSPLRALALLQDVAPFRQACIHAVASNEAHGLQEACDLGRGFAALARSGLLAPALPGDCLQCTDGDKPRAVGDVYEYKLPNKQADIVIAVETTKATEKTFKSLVVPLLSQVIDQLKAKHCADIKVHLVGITAKFPYPILYDTDLKLKNAKITFSDESRYDDLFQSIKTGDEKVDQRIKNFVDILNAVRVDLGILNVESGAAELLQASLRPAAVKHLMYVIGENTRPVNPILIGLSSIVHEPLLENNAVSVSLVSTVSELELGGGKSAQQVVGFNKKAVLFVGKTDPAARASLKWNDSYVDWTQDIGGLALSSSNFLALPADQQKQFLGTAAEAVTDSLLSQTQQQRCRCAQLGDRAASVCIKEL